MVWPATAPRGPARLLVHQARFHIGDVLWLTPLLRAARVRFPTAEITVVGPPVAERVLSGNPHVTKIIPYPEGGSPSERRQVLEALGDFDVALLAFARWPESTWLAKALAERDVAVRVNLEYFDDEYDAGRLAPWATHEGWCPWSVLPSPEMMLHALDPFFEHGATGHHVDRKVDFHISSAARQRARRWLRERGLGGQPLVVLSPGGYSSDRWLAEKFAELATRLVGELGVGVLIEGSAKEEALVEEVRRLALRECRVDLRARLYAATDPLEEFAALLADARLLVANDSAPIHLAEAVGTPSLYFAQREKLVHSHPAGPAWALFDDVRDAVSDITVGQAAGAIREMVATGVVDLGMS